MDTTSSAVVAERIAPMVPTGETVAARLSRHPAPHAYAELLCLLHHTIRASSPLLEAATRRAAELAGSDPVAAALVPYLREHAEEELHHDEWLLDDYASLGRDPAEVLNRPPSPTVASLVGSVYYWVLHYHPVAILGYLLALEGNPPGDDLIADLQAQTGLPDEAFRTLRHHGAVDVHHGAELAGLIDSLGLTEDRTEFVALVAMHCLERLITAQLELLADLDAGAGGLTGGARRARPGRRTPRRSPGLLAMF